MLNHRASCPALQAGLCAKGGNILVVDDDRQLTQSVCACHSDCGYQTRGVQSAQEAYDAMYSTQYDLIIPDIRMPGTDGYAFTKTVRSLNKTVPILLISDRDDLPFKQKGFDLGIDDYMVKPVDLSELLMRALCLALSLTGLFCWGGRSTV